MEQQCPPDRQAIHSHHQLVDGHRRRFCRRTGRVGHVCATLGDDIPVHRYDGGVILQAGPYPKTGDRDRGHIPGPYQKIAQLLDPLIFKDFSAKLPYIHAPHPLESLDETKRWIERFKLAD
ncbi:type VI immunity family protein [Oryzifoliimicrobium ureilyticus]|uniref:type VI immunity family protein n=1 Tax=Oryzifoliimicrobium ureilyticus TaxID=3113724 RepID=UPI003F67D315